MSSTARTIIDDRPILKDASMPWTYRVRVKSNSYLYEKVDLSAYNWNGSCTCAAFEFCCRPRLMHHSRNAHENIEDARCDHILQAREWVMDNEFPEMVKRLESTQAALAMT